MQITKELSLDYNSASYATLCVKQYDKESRQIIVKCYNNGVEVTFDSSYTYKLRAKAADGLCYEFNDIVTASGNELTFVLPTVLAVESGIVSAEILVTDGTQLLYTTVFNIKVEASAFTDEEVIAEDKDRAIVQLLAEMTDMRDTTKEYRDEAQTAAASAGQSAKEAATSEKNAATSATNAATSEKNAKDSADASEASAEDSKAHEDESIKYSKISKSYAVGTHGEIRTGDDEDNASYYCGLAQKTLESKADLSLVNTCITNLTYNNKTGVITATFASGVVKDIIDTDIEKMAVNFDYDETTQKLILTLEDGTTKEVDLSSFIAETEYDDSDTIDFSVSEHRVSAVIKAGSIDGTYLKPDYLNEIKTQVQAAADSATASANSATASDTSAGQSAEHATKAADWAAVASNAQRICEASEASAASASSAAKGYQDNAKTSATNAAESETKAKAYMEAANTSATNAASSEANASTSETNSKASEDAALDYKNQMQVLKDSINGLFKICKTITYEELSSQEKATGYAYVISNSFTTDDTFMNPGVSCTAGTIVYYTTNSKWDIMPGTTDAITDEYINNLFGW